MANDLADVREAKFLTWLDTWNFWLSKTINPNCVRDISDIRYGMKNNETIRPKTRPKTRPKIYARSKISNQQAEKSINIGIDFLLLNSF